MNQGDETEDMTVDELARRAGLVVSTVRLYQHRGLLAPPEKRGRVGWYGPDHLRRLRLIGELQERGYSLAAIKDLVEGMEAGRSLQGVLGLGGGSTWQPEEAVRMSLAELAGHLPTVTITPEVVARVAALGLVELDAETGEAVVGSPSFLDIGSRLAAMGVDGDEILDEYEALRGHAEEVADRFTDLFRRHVWEPFVADGLPAEGLARVTTSLEELGPLAERVVLMALRQALQAGVERFVEAEAATLGIDIPRPGTG